MPHVTTSNVATRVLKAEYLKNHHREALQILAIKNVLFNPSFLYSYSRDTNVIRIVHRCRQFVIPEPNVYLGGSNAGYFVAKAISFVDFTWPDVAKNAAETTEL